MGAHRPLPVGGSTIAAVVAATLAAAVAIAFVLDGTALLVRAYVVTPGAIAAWLAYTRLSRTLPHRAAPRPDRAASDERPAELRSLEQQTRPWLFLDYHAALRPTLYSIAASRLRSHRGIDPDADPTAARALLGDAAWDLLRQRDLADIDRTAPPPDERTLTDLVYVLECI